MDRDEADHRCRKRGAQECREKLGFQLRIEDRGWKMAILDPPLLDFQPPMSLRVTSAATYRRQDSERHQACRLTNRAADKVRIRYQSQDGETNWTDDSTVGAVPRGSSVQISGEGQK
jgi:hypothetical protein